MTDQNHAQRIIENPRRMYVVISQAIQKLDAGEWRKAVRVITEKEKNYPPAHAKHTIERFYDILILRDRETIVYTMGELSRIEESVKQKVAVPSKAVTLEKICDVERIVLDSILFKSISQENLCSLHDLLLLMNLRADKMEDINTKFNAIKASVEGTPKKLRGEVLGLLYRIATYPFEDEDAGNKNQLLMVSAQNLQKKCSTMGQNLSLWVENALGKHQSIAALNEFFKNDFGYFSDDLALLGLPLPKVQERLLAYVEALTGRKIKIEQTNSHALSCSFDGDAFFLPPVVSVGKKEEDNFKVYKVLASYLAGAFLFGTYTPDPSKTEAITAKRFGETRSLSAFFSSFGNPEFARKVFGLLEFSRLDYFLAEKFPGLKDDLLDFNAIMAYQDKQSEISTPAIRTIRSSVFSICSGAPKKDNLEDILSAEINALRAKDSSVEKTLESTERVYRALEKKHDLSVEQRGEEIMTFAIKEINEERKNGASHRVQAPENSHPLGKTFRYDEWDHKKGEYKKGFVQVVQREYPNVIDNTYVHDVLQGDHATMQRLRGVFESLRPEEAKKVTYQLSGDIDYDLLVKAKAEQEAGITPSEKIYTREYKNTRSVTSLVLVESSGSLRKFLDIRKPDMKVIDVIKRAKICFSEALDAIGDPYALAAFSGETEKNVEFYMIKDFEQPYNAGVKRVVGSISPLKQNRDAAGIRHATMLLARQPEKTRLLFYLMEGLPKDVGYEGAYAIADMQKAIVECKLKGCLPIIIASGKEINQEVRTLADHCVYREVTDHRAVPELLPNIYRKITM